MTSDARYTSIDVIQNEVRFPSDGTLIRGVMIRPRPNRPYPALVMIHELFGLGERSPYAGPHMRDVGNRLAREGYAVLLPDLYTRHGDPGDLMHPGAMQRARALLPDRQVVQDLEAAAAFLRGLPVVAAGHVGTIGYCSGGLQALLFACSSEQLAAAAVYYGTIVYRELTDYAPVSPIDLVPNLSCPLLGIFGELDQGIPVEQVKHLEETLQKHGRTGEIHLYPGAQHGFFNDRRPDRHHPEAARQAWSRTLAFFDQHLKG